MTPTTARESASARPTERRAVIDVGTNSVKLLVGDVSEAGIEPVWEQGEQTRLGRGFYETHELQGPAIEHTAEVVARFVIAAREHGARRLRVIATSAARDATNQSALVDAVRTASGLALEVISGQQEAEWVFQGVTTAPQFVNRRVLILDVGGGSTEFILGERGHHSFRQSFPLGSVRLTEKFRPSDPPSPADLTTCRQWLKNFFDEHLVLSLESLLGDAERGAVQLIGTGGATTVLARMELQADTYDRVRIESVRLSREAITRIMHTLWTLPLAERKQLIGVPPDRADIILFGAAICEAVMEHFHFGELRVSTRGLRFGALVDF